MIASPATAGVSRAIGARALRSLPRVPRPRASQCRRGQTPPRSNLDAFRPGGQVVELPRAKALHGSGGLAIEAADGPSDCGRALGRTYGACWRGSCCTYGDFLRFGPADGPEFVGPTSVRRLRALGVASDEKATKASLERGRECAEPARDSVGQGRLLES